MPKCSGCSKVINGGKWCRICFVSAYSDQPEDTPQQEEDKSPTTFLCKTTLGETSPQDFIYNSDESTSSTAYSQEESCDSNFDEEHPHHHQHQQHNSSSSEDSFPEKVAVCGEVDRHERDFIELVKDNMLKHQQQQTQHIKRLEEHVKYLRSDVLFLKNDIENKNMVIKYLLGKLRQSGAGALNESSNSSMDEEEVEDSICHTVRINGSVSGPKSYGANKTLREEQQCVDAWSVSITENSMKTLQQSVKQIEL